MCAGRELFMTGWLAEDCVADNDWFGAQRVLVLAASSKTAISLRTAHGPAPASRSSA
ncbi:MAG: DUF2855 family protein [Ornithinibacter sp.]